MASITAFIQSLEIVGLLILGIGAACLLLCFLIAGRILEIRRLKRGQRLMQDALIRYHQQQQEPVDDEPM